MKQPARKGLAYSVKSAKYGPIETENDRVGTTDAKTPEAKEDDHGLAAWRKRKRGGKVEGDKPKMRMDRAPRGRHPDAAEDKALIRKMVKSDDLKRPERARGGKVSGKGTKINIIVAPGAGGAGGPPMGAAMVPPPPPAPTMIRAPAPMPQGMPQAGGAPMAGGMPPGLGRRAGGRVGESHKYPKMDAGSMSGEGRLEKVAKYGRKASEKD